MAKIPSAYVQYATLVAYRKGRVAKIARWLHKRIKNRFLHNLGYEEIEVLNTPQVIGFVESKNDDGSIVVKLNPITTGEWHTSRNEPFWHEHGEN